MSTPFRLALSSRLIATDVAGAFVSPGADAAVDLNTAAPDALARQGYFWRRPVDGDDPALFRAWQLHLGQPWSAEKRIVPQQKPMPGRVHRAVRRKGGGQVASEISNWSGGVVTGQFTSAAGAWVIPTVSKPTEVAGSDGGWDSSSWVGLDGSGSNDVLQAGIEQRVDSHGNASYYAWYEWFCVYAKQTLGDTSPLTPALASLNGRLYIAWRGDGNKHLNVMVSHDDGQTFANKIVSPETSDDAPALATDGSNLYIAWKGAGNDQLNVARVTLDGPTGNPLALANKVILGDTSPVRPALAVLGGALYLAWKGDGNDQLNLMVSLDQGHSFGHKYVSGENSPRAPGLAAHNGGLFVTWKGDGNDQLNVASVALANSVVTGFGHKSVLGDTSPLSPSMASFNGGLYLAWRGDGNDNLNLMVSTDNGVTFGRKCVSGETSTDAMSVVAHNGHLFAGWKGDGNDHLNVSLVGILRDGSITGFTTPAYREEVQIPNFAVKPGDTVHCSVQYLANATAGQVSFGSTTSGQNFQITLVPPPGAAISGNSAEWIMEVPTINGSLAHLPSFTPVAFTGAIACGPGAAGNPSAGTVVTIFDDADHALTTATLGNETVTISHL